MNQNDELQQLGYASSAPDFMTADTPHPQDEADISTLVEILALVRNRKEYFQTIASLSLEDATFTVEQQLAINGKVLFHLQELESKLNSAITKVKEKNNER